MDWDKLRVFHAVAEAGSFTHAGETLNLSQSAVSRQISALEDNLQVPLFHRHARGLILTEQGESLNRTVREVLVALRQRYGERAPSYHQLWHATQDGRVSVIRDPACLMIQDDDATIVAALGLEGPRPRPGPKPKPRPNLPTAA